jgi:ferredoxin, 2Fe-2S
MATVTFHTPSGGKVVVPNASGTLMETAVDNHVEGIGGDCGGVCSCATCHVRVAPEWMERVGPPGHAEKELLEYNDATTDHSRLSCQIELTDDLDGLVVTVVPSS